MVSPTTPSTAQDSAERDSEFLRVEEEIGASKRPSIVLGDLNDVAWSRTTSDFKEAAGLWILAGVAGFFNTFPAAVPGLRYPLDYVFPFAALCSRRYAGSSPLSV